MDFFKSFLTTFAFLTGIILFIILLFTATESFVVGSIGWGVVSLIGACIFPAALHAWIHN